MLHRNDAVDPPEQVHELESGSLLKAKVTLSKKDKCTETVGLTVVDHVPEIDGQVGV